jgi:hypothetical protein
MVSHHEVPAAEVSMNETRGVVECSERASTIETLDQRIGESGAESSARA